MAKPQMTPEDRASAVESVRATRARHHAERPVTKLTEAELTALTQIGQMAHFFKPELCDSLFVLAELADSELIERDYKTATGG